MLVKGAPVGNICSAVINILCVSVFVSGVGVGGEDMLVNNLLCNFWWKQMEYLTRKYDFVGLLYKGSCFDVGEEAKTFYIFLPVVKHIPHRLG